MRWGSGPSDGRLRAAAQAVHDYADFTRSFVNIQDARIAAHVDHELAEGLLWPDPIVQLNPSFESGRTIDELVDEGLLDERCRQIFRRAKTSESPEGLPLRLHRHQREAVEVARTGANYVLTTGTGSGKSLAYIVPIVDHVLKTSTPEIASDRFRVRSSRG